MFVNKVHMDISDSYTRAPTEIKIESSPTVILERLKYQKIMFITNALDFGWTVKKRGDSYIFTKKHEGKKEIFHENYLESFIKTNLVDDLAR
jgi:hypothetical protein